MHFSNSSLFVFYYFVAAIKLCVFYYFVSTMKLSLYHS